MGYSRAYTRFSVPVTVISEPAAGRTTDWLRPLVCCAILLVLAVGWWLPTEVEPRAQRALAVAVSAILLWTTHLIHPAWTGVLAVAFLFATGLTDVETLGAGLRGETVWFLGFAMILGLMATRSGLAERVAFMIAARAGHSYAALLLGFIAIDLVLTFFVPSGIARVTILAAIVLGLIDAAGLRGDASPARGLMLAVTYSGGLFDKMILAGATAILASGLIERLTGQRLTYASWITAFGPALALSVGVCWSCTLWLYPDRARELDHQAGYFRERLGHLGEWTPVQKRTAVLLPLAVLLWMTDALHHVRPVVVAGAVSILGVLPGIGILRVRDLRHLRYSVLVFTAAGLSLTAILMETGGLALLTSALTEWMKGLVSGPLSAAVVMYWSAFLYHLFLGAESSLISATMPAILQFARDQHLPVVPIGLIWTFAASGKVFAYQSAVLMVGFATGVFTARDLARFGLVMTVVESVVLLLIVGVYWPLVGLL